MSLGATTAVKPDIIGCKEWKDGVDNIIMTRVCLDDPFAYAKTQVTIFAYAKTRGSGMSRKLSTDYYDGESIHRVTHVMQKAGIFIL